MDQVVIEEAWRWINTENWMISHTLHHAISNKRAKIKYRKIKRTWKCCDAWGLCEFMVICNICFIWWALCIPPYVTASMESLSSFTVLYGSGQSRRCHCLVTWFCYQLIAKPGNMTAATLWPELYIFLIKCMVSMVSVNVHEIVDARTSAGTVMKKIHITYI